jgi:hypothetical protein
MKRSFAAIAAIVVTSVALVAVELTARLVDGYHLNSLRLEVSRERPPRAAPAPTTGSQKLEGENDALPFVRELPVAAGVDREWFTMPLPARPPVKADPVLVARMEKYRGGVDERANYEWNWRSVTGAVCRGEHPTFRDIFKQFDDIFVFDPTDGSDEPPYRFLPNIAYSSGLQTNTYGWRGPDGAGHRPGHETGEEPVGLLILFWVMAPISTSHWAPLTWRSSPIRLTSSSHARKPR